MGKISFIILITLFVTNQTFAQLSDFAFSGAGASSCGKYLESRAESDKAIDGIYISWLQGFLSGANLERHRSGKAMVNLPDGESILSYTDKYCRENPLASVIEAAFVLNRELEE